MNCVFERFEQKYKIPAELYESVKKELENFVKRDEYGETTVCSLYYDTKDYRLIRTSIEKPKYKEKLRLRCYGFGKDKKVFLELKKKAYGVVYKRRIVLKSEQAFAFFENGEPLPSSQIAREITYFKEYYDTLSPAFLVMYDRTAYLGQGDLRITLDKNTRYREERLNFWSGGDGEALLENGEVLMEIKTSNGYPFWLVDILNKYALYPYSFSKVGTAYLKKIDEKNKIRKAG